MLFPILLKSFLNHLHHAFFKKINQILEEREGNRGGGWGGEHPKKAIQTTDGDDESDLIFS